ncbi:MAG: hypothetical protein ACFE8A_13430 [Candidatus Hodarchaeota archaeon]
MANNNISKESEKKILDYLKEGLPNDIWIFHKLRAKIKNITPLESLKDVIIEDYNFRKEMAYRDVFD